MASSTFMRLATLVALCSVFARATYADAPTLSISVVVASHEEPARIVYANVNSHFHVLLSNLSGAPLKIWEQDNSWGYSALSFEFTDEGGKTWVVRRTGTIFTMNIPASWVVEPHGHLVLDVYFGDEKSWERFPWPDKGSRAVTMRAIYAVEPTPESARYGVWTGRAVSSARTVVFSR